MNIEALAELTNHQMCVVARFVGSMLKAHHDAVRIVERAPYPGPDVVRDVILPTLESAEILKRVGRQPDPAEPTSILQYVLHPSVDREVLSIYLALWIGD